MDERSRGEGHTHLAIHERDLEAHILLYVRLHGHHRLDELGQSRLRLCVVLLGTLTRTSTGKMP
eukprot:1130660-Prorocentrum_minimum.AAC.2